MCSCTLYALFQAIIGLANNALQDRVYCSDKQVPSIYSSGMRLFRDHILQCRTGVVQPDGSVDTILVLVIRTMLDHIKMERDGDAIDKTMLKSCTFMLEGIYVDNVETDDFKLYNYSFEGQYLLASRKFYATESEHMLRDSSAGEYLRQAKKRLGEEEDRCRSTLAEATMPRIELVVLEELIAKRMQELMAMDTGINFMITNDRTTDMKNLYELSGKVDESNTELVKALQTRILDMGSEINQMTIQQPANSEAAPGIGAGQLQVAQTQAAIRWVAEVLNLKDKFDKIWAEAFNKDPRMQTAMTKSFSEFINSQTFSRSAEYVSLFIDENMKKGIKDKTEAEVDIILDKAITLLRYISDRDMFERYYKKHLSKRLLLGRSVSIDVENQMIGKMKIELGNAFTSKIEAMFKDMAISNELTSNFKQHVLEINANEQTSVRPIDLSIHVLTSMTWPNELANNPNDSNQQTQPIIFPPVVERVRQRFNTFYASKHSGRKLTWVTAMGTADIKARFPGANKERIHDLNVSTYAMIILMLFNDLEDGASLSFEDIQSQTNIPHDDLKRNLQSLACVSKTRILVKSPASKDVNETDQFTFNTSFQSKFMRVKVNTVASGNRVETDRERLKTEQKNDESRQYICEAAIVRIMKQRKELTHAQLLAETLSQLTSFKPEVALIKSRIEGLIEREYLERVEGDDNKYRYLA
jgi:cullin 3